MTAPGFVHGLFFGEVADDLVASYPGLAGTERERVLGLLGAVRELAARVIDSERIDSEREIDEPVFEALRGAGLFGLGIPAEAGGGGLSMFAQARVLQEVAAHDASVAVMLAAHVATGARTIVVAGTPEQKARLLPPLARGEVLAAFALTERESGSDPETLRTVAEPHPDGGYVLRGSKPWVTNGDRAGLVAVVARTNPLEAGLRARLGVFIVERGEGVRSGGRRDTSGVRGAHVCTLELDGVRVPAGALIGAVGDGIGVAREVLRDARILLAAAGVGQCRATVNLLVQRLVDRRSVGRSIGEYSILKDRLVRALADTFAVESLVYLAAGLADRGADVTLESLAARVAVSEALQRVVGEALQVGAAGAYVRPHPLERQMRDARAWLLLDGTNEVLRGRLALGGVRGPADRRDRDREVLAEPVKGLSQLRELAIRSVRERFQRPRPVSAHPALAREAAAYEAAVDRLGKAVERLVREHGTELVEKQNTQARLANVAIDLFAMAAVLSRTTAALRARGEAGSRRELDLATIFSGAAERRVNAGLTGLERNDDELRKAIAGRTYEDGGYPFDVV
ncbi:MAG: acyl-CoA dehydrogenase family protein [Polyangiaceae bacterium]|nr:acyl-CoA dehydrogenase family protein [Polyangiaceae bacterium]